MQKTKYYADIYLRISKEDGDKEESESIANQRALILNFANSLPDLKVHKIRIDDGYSGVHFNRPSFIEMIKDIQSGIVNCVIVKDFSRFGRNYIETGKYIQALFPSLGIRFISVNDSYDSSKDKSYAENIIVPFKNMINDAYSSDISAKVRSHLEIKRRKGEFVGAFAAYGYIKDENSKSRLVVDSFAADVVKDIFDWKLDGMSALKIAEKLNENGILSPMEYKRYTGLRFSTPFKINPSAKWQAKSVLRILTNEIYTGVLEQGKRLSPNYKIRKQVSLPKEKWAKIENAHEAIIERALFDIVQSLLKQSARSASKNSSLRPLSGLIFCADCKASMVHKSNIKNGKRYGYYVCSAHRLDKSVCSTHNINSDACEKAVLSALQSHKLKLSAQQSAKYAEILTHDHKSSHKLSSRLKAKQDELKRSIGYLQPLYESYKGGVIPYEDFISFTAIYNEKIQRAKAALISLENEIETAACDENQNLMDVSYAESDNLSRKMVAMFVDKVLVYKSKQIKVIFKYANEQVVL